VLFISLHFYVHQERDLTIPETGKRPKQDRPPVNDPGIWRMNRRNFLSTGGWWAFFIFIGVSVVGAIRTMFPRVLYEPASAFKAGYPADYLVGEVSERFKESQRVWIIRDQGGFYALSATCTHLGCTPRWLETENKFKCPCHGSGFQRNGINFEGPAPRPLERLRITRSDDGQIAVDRNVTFRYEDGGWTKSDAYLPYTG
jgi:cytochrome b6-f complex iron-sulfur subunit